MAKSKQCKVPKKMTAGLTTGDVTKLEESLTIAIELEVSQRCALPQHS
jgi:hypothetical protein